MSSIEKRLETLGRRRTELVARLEAVELELVPLVVEAVAGGMAKERVARAAGLNRQTVYNWLRRGRRARGAT